MEKRNQICILFRGRIRQALELWDNDFSNLQEIRLRAGQPLLLRYGNEELFLDEAGRVSKAFRDAVIPDRRELGAVVETACGYSGYAFEEELKRGFVTIQGGHRIGIVGQAVVENGRIQSMKYITGLNIRIAHEVPGCAKKWEEFFYERDRPCHMLLISPPGGGKTTMLREIIRIYSDGSKQFEAVNVGVADERSEIGGCFKGEKSFYLGMRTDVMDGCPKIIGMEMILRSMAPDVIAVDEIGAGEVAVIESSVRSGCRVLATLHGEMLDDFTKKESFANLVKERIFERYLILQGKKYPGRIAEIFDKNFNLLWREKGCMESL